ncbi:MAG: EamA family transporter, partial [Actinobacteria bacterium]|nr:EamA family transporter [Actinomycetota bacterium]
MIDSKRTGADWAIPAVIVATVAWGIGPLMVRAMDVSGYANRLVGERSDVRRLPFALVAFAGLAVVILSGASTDGASLKGDLWAGINVCCFTIYFLTLKKRRNEGMDGWAFLAGVFIVGGVLITPFCIIMGNDTTSITRTDILYLLIMVAGPGLVGHGLISWASRHIPVTTTSLLTLGSPVISVFGGWLVYDQHLGWTQVFGAALVLTEPAMPVAGLPNVEVDAVWTRAVDAAAPDPLIAPGSDAPL